MIEAIQYGGNLTKRKATLELLLRMSPFLQPGLDVLNLFRMHLLYPLGLFRGID